MNGCVFDPVHISSTDSPKYYACMLGFQVGYTKLAIELILCSSKAVETTEAEECSTT